MQFNTIFFRPPAPTYTKKDFLGMDRLFEVPTQNVNNSKQQLSVPCVLMPFLYGGKEMISKYYIVYFHGNAEDLGTSYDFLYDLRTVVRCNIILTEYCGYGLYKQLKPSCKQVEYDADKIFQFITKTLNINRSNIILLGRSMGSGPACMLAAKYQPRGLMLISAFTSLKGVAANMVGVLSSLVSDRFKNIEQVEKVQCPVLLIHGKMDTLVPYNHSQMLAEKLLVDVLECYQNGMTHNDYDIDIDIINNIQQFLREKMNIFQKKNDPILSKFEKFPTEGLLVNLYPELDQRQQQKQAEQNKEKKESTESNVQKEIEESKENGFQDKNRAVSATEDQQKEQQINKNNDIKDNSNNDINNLLLKKTALELAPVVIIPQNHTNIRNNNPQLNNILENELNTDRAFTEETPMLFHEPHRSNININRNDNINLNPNNLNNINDNASVNQTNYLENQTEDQQSFA